MQVSALWCVSVFLPPREGEYRKSLAKGMTVLLESQLSQPLGVRAGVALSRLPPAGVSRSSHYSEVAWSEVLSA